MRLNILTFGIVKDIVGSRNLTLELSENATTDELKQAIITQYPDLEKLKSLLIAVNNEYTYEVTVLNEQDEIALIPPVSGG